MWKRLDESKLRNMGGERGKRRAYGKDGKDGKTWPRIVLSVAPCTIYDEYKTFTINCSKKDGPGKWWEKSYIPEELRSELIDFLKEG
jgi:hypothetical protein